MGEGSAARSGFARPRSGPTRKSGDFVGQRGQLAVTVRDAAGRVRPPAQDDARVANRDIGMVVLALGDAGHTAYERKRLRKAGELEFPLERASTSAQPSGVDMGTEYAAIAHPRPNEL